MFINTECGKNTPPAPGSLQFSQQSLVF